MLRLNRLRWYGHVERSDKWINKYTNLEIDGFKGRGRPRKTWSATVTEDLKALIQIMHMIDLCGRSH